MTEKHPLRFAVLFHEYPPGHLRDDHWDLMLEHDGQLLTWSLPVLPEPGKSISATRLADHRIDYLEYEGGISGDRGSVSRIMDGIFFWKNGFESRVANLEFGTSRWEIRFQPQGESTVLITVRTLAKPVPPNPGSDP